jgi:dolichol-phosphate mannosyltransferase
MKISFVIPAYNEEFNLIELYNRISALEILKEFDYKLIFVDDGSTDNTLKNIKQLKTHDNKINFISLSRNFGHQCALRAGIDFADGDIIIMLDADLQHPPELITEMLVKWEEGYNIITTKRIDTIKLPVYKKSTSKLFYKILNWISDIKLEPGSADFRLIDKKVADVIKNSPEGDIFFRGYISWIGFKQYQIIFNSNVRFSGKSKYSIKRMMNFAINGITSFSIKPLRIAVVLGLIFSLSAFMYSIYALCIVIFTDKALQGWASVIISVLFLGGIQLIVIGILGEYLSKIFLQVKGRPTYVVNETSL